MAIIWCGAVVSVFIDDVFQFGGNLAFRFTKSCPVLEKYWNVGIHACTV